MYDFSKNQTLDNLDAVPEDFKSFYKEGEDGKHKLDTENAVVRSSISNLTKLHQSLNAARAEAAGLKGKSVDLSALGEFGDSPDTILQTFKTQLEAAREIAKADGDQDLQRQLDKIKQDLAKTHSVDLEKRDNRIGALQGQLYDKMVKSDAKSALSTAGVIDVDLALPFVEKQVKVSEQDGKFSVNVVDSAGDVRYSGVTGQPMTVNELVLEVKADPKFQPLFKSEAPAGGGTPPGGASGHAAQHRRPEGSEKSPNEKIASGLARNLHSTQRRTG